MSSNVTRDFTDSHECVFVEEREPSGRLVLPPCIVCGTSAMDALDQLREWEQTRAEDLAKCRERLATVLREASEKYAQASEQLEWWQETADKRLMDLDEAQQRIANVRLALAKLAELRDA